ncbi:MAG TPA: transglutaminaseTgpA domain-containing protein [Frankiaceae bacterium]|nr:transglutaminaseTgpA domain-containing protein [Frankiaceae bacterium]
MIVWAFLGAGCATAVAGGAFLGVYRGGGLGAAVAVAGLAPAVVAALTERRRTLRVARPVLSAGLVTLATLLLLDGPGDLAGGAVHGWARTLDSVWPVRATPATAAWVPLLTGLASVAAVELVARVRWPAVALGPPLLVLVLAQAYDARSGRDALVLAAAFAGCAAVTLAAARSRPAARDGARRRVRRVAGLGLPLALGVAVVAPAVAAPEIVHRDPYLLKEHRPVADLPEVVGNPLGQVGDLLAQPEAEVFRARTVAPVDRWTLAVLDTYDGEQWRPSARFRPLGAELAPDPDALGPAQAGEAVFKVAALPGPWLPSQPRTTAVTGADVGVDPDTGTLVRGGPVAGLQYRLHWSAPDPGDRDLATLALAADPASTRVSAPTAVPEQAVSLARTLTEATGPTLSGAFAIEEHLRTGSVLVTGGDRIPTGHSFATLVAFLGSENRQGTTEQFAAAYALLARLAGIPARVAVGFRQPETPEPDGTFVVRGKDALAWPEIHVSGLGWVPLDPAPSKGGDAQRRTKLATATHKARLAAATPAPRESGGPAVPVGQGQAPQPDRSGAPVAVWAVAGLALAVPISVPVAKAVRRRRRRGAGDPGRAVVGAWLEARDRLRDHGVGVPRGATAYDLADLPADGLRDCGDDLRTIAGCVDLALWSGGYLRDEHVATAWRSADAVARRLRRASTARAATAAFDPRSLFAR